MRRHSLYPRTFYDSVTKRTYRSRLHLGTKGPAEGLTPGGLLDTGYRRQVGGLTCTDPGAAAGKAPTDLQRPGAVAGDAHQPVDGCHPAAADAGSYRLRLSPTVGPGAGDHRYVAASPVAGSGVAPSGTAPSAVSAHISADTASPPSAGCHTISPASFCTHSPSAHSWLA